MHTYYGLFTVNLWEISMSNIQILPVRSGLRERGILIAIATPFSGL